MAEVRHKGSPGAQNMCSKESVPKVTGVTHQCVGQQLGRGERGPMASGAQSGQVATSALGSGHAGRTTAHTGDC